MSMFPLATLPAQRLGAARRPEEAVSEGMCSDDSWLPTQIAFGLCEVVTALCPEPGSRGYVCAAHPCLSRERLMCVAAFLEGYSNRVYVTLVHAPAREAVRLSLPCPRALQHLCEWHEEFVPLCEPHCSCLEAHHPSGSLLAWARGFLSEADRCHCPYGRLCAVVPGTQRASGSNQARHAESTVEIPVSALQRLRPAHREVLIVSCGAGLWTLHY